MRLYFLISGFALAATSIPAQSSEAERIIVHCATLQTDSVRLACFDAVVALTRPKKTDFERAALPSSPLLQSEAVPNSSVDGFYLGGGVKAGFGPELNLFNGPGSGVQPFDHSSAAWTVFAGHNWTFDQYMVGIEGSVAGDTASESVYVGGFQRLQETIAPTLSARAGMELENILVFARAGLGASVLQLTDSRLINPTSTYVFPAASFGIGAEVNFNDFFLRIEGEGRHVMIEADGVTFDPDDSLTTYRAGLGLGLRF